MYDFVHIINDGMTSALISFGRTLVFQIIAVLVLPIFFGVIGVWSAVILVEVLASILSIFCFIRNRKKYSYI